MKHMNNIQGIKKHLPVLVSLGLGVLLSIVLFAIVHNWEQENQRIEFESRAMSCANAMKNNLYTYEEALHSLGDFYKNSEQVTRQEFTSFTKSSIARHQGIQAFGWAPLVLNNERAAYESSAREVGFEDFEFTELSAEKKLVRAAERPEYFVAYYIEPLETNQPALGFDIASTPTRLQAITNGFASGKISLTEKITLVQDTGQQSGFLLLLPIYQRGALLKSADDRRKYRKGFVVEVLRIGDVVEEAMNHFSDDGMNTYLYELHGTDEDKRFLYFRSSGLGGVTEQPLNEKVVLKGLYWNETFDFAGHPFKIVFCPSSAYLNSHPLREGWVILFASLLSTFMLTFYLFNKNKQSEVVEQMVREQFQTNLQLEDEISERKKVEEDLKKHRKNLEQQVEERTLELKQVQSQLLNKEKLAAIGQLAATVRHDLRNPLGVISNSIYFLRMKLQDPDEKVAKHLDLLSREVKNADSIITGLLDFSKVMPPELEQCDIRELIDAAQAGILFPRDIEISINQENALSHLHADRSQITRVFANLISNGVKAMPDGGRLTISFGVEEDMAVIRFQDTGRGIPAENLEKIFEPLFTTSSKGSGLGLAIVRNFIELHHGGIEVESEINKGSVFTVRLPMNGKERVTTDSNGKAEAGNS